MNMTSLIAKLKERPRTPNEHREETREQWLAAIGDLFARIEGWLAEAEAQSVLTASRAQMVVVEPDSDDLDDYAAPSLTITDRERRTKVRLEPIGARVDEAISSSGVRHGGFRGRVDLVCGPARIPLMRAEDDRWTAIPDRGGPSELTEESFAEILSGLFLDE